MPVADEVHPSRALELKALTLVFCKRHVMGPEPHVRQLSAHHKHWATCVEGGLSLGSRPWFVYKMLGVQTPVACQNWTLLVYMYIYDINHVTRGETDLKTVLVCWPANEVQSVLTSSIWHYRKNKFLTIKFNLFWRTHSFLSGIWPEWAQRVTTAIYVLVVSRKRRGWCYTYQEDSLSHILWALKCWNW